MKCGWRYNDEREWTQGELSTARGCKDLVITGVAGPTLGNAEYHFLSDEMQVTGYVDVRDGNYVLKTVAIRFTKPKG